MARWRGSPRRSADMVLGRSTSGAIKIKTDDAGGGLRAVSCGCCGCAELSGECYPASELGKTIFYDDLPDQIYVRGYYIGDEIGVLGFPTVSGILYKTNPFPEFLPFGLYGGFLPVSYPPDYIFEEGREYPTEAYLTRVAIPDENNSGEILFWSEFNYSDSSQCLIYCQFYSADKPFGLVDTLPL